jgi:hypothetical protein
LYDNWKPCGLLEVGLWRTRQIDRQAESEVGSPVHDPASSFSLSPLVNEIRGDHILHGDTHSLIYGNLVIAETPWFPTESHCPKSREVRRGEGNTLLKTHEHRALPTLAG